MSRSMLQNPPLIFLLCISFFGILLSALLVVFPPVLSEDFVWRKHVVGFVFGSICVLGILAAFFPNQCTNILNLGKGKEFTLHGHFSQAGGHHPNCENFSSHVFRIGSRRMCVACTGLTIGGLVTLAGTSLYFFVGWYVEQYAVLMVLAGLVGVSLGLFQFVVKHRFIRFYLNASFVFGAFLVLVGIDNLTQSVFADLFLVALIVFWLFTRISISQWDHERVCYACSVVMCEFRKGGRG